MTAGATVADGILADPGTQAYLEQTVRTWLGARAGVAVPELPAPLARRVLRLEELERPHRSAYGCWEHGYGESYRRGRLWSPEVDEWLATARAELPGAELEPLWPDGAPFAGCLTHDVDVVSRRSTPRQALRHAGRGFARPGGRGALARLATPPVRLARAARAGIAGAPSTEDVLEASVAVEQQAGVTGSYLFTAAPGGPRSRYDCSYDPSDPCRFRGRRTTVAGVMRELADEGFDVGLHGSYGGATAPGALAAERAALERATGLAIVSTRQHFLHWHVQTTPRLQEEAGLLADSSMGFNRDVGFRAGTSLPFRQLDLERRRPLALLQVPLVVQDGGLLRDYGLELDLALAVEAVEHVVDTVARTGGLVTFLFHPDNLVDPDALALYRHTVAELVRRGAWIASLAQIERWWRKREGRLALAAS